MVAWTHNCPSPHPTLEAVAGIDADDLEDRLAQARTLLSVSDEITRGGIRQTRVLQRARELYPRAKRQPAPMPLAARFEHGIPHYAGAGDLLGVDRSDSSQLRVLSEHVAIRLHHAGGNATILDVVARDGRSTAQLSANHFVLAAGAIGTPKLLVASDVDDGSTTSFHLGDLGA